MNRLIWTKRVLRSRCGLRSALFLLILSKKQIKNIYKLAYDKYILDPRPLCLLFDTILAKHFYGKINLYIEEVEIIIGIDRWEPDTYNVLYFSNYDERTEAMTELYQESLNW